MAAMAAVTLLSTRGLSRALRRAAAVDDVDFDLAAGEIRAIIGPNGAGKTTFVSLICGRVAPIGGPHRLRRRGHHRRCRRTARVGRGIAYTFQITSVFGNLSVFDNVALAAQSSMQRRSSAWRPLDIGKSCRRARRRGARAGRPRRRARDAKAAELAYGHQRLLEVAMGLALAPKLLILDEPTQGLSDSEIESFCELIRAIAARGDGAPDRAQHGRGDAARATGSP